MAWIVRCFLMVSSTTKVEHKERLPPLTNESACAIRAWGVVPAYKDGILGRQTER